MIAGFEHVWAMKLKRTDIVSRSSAQRVNCVNNCQKVDLPIGETIVKGDGG